MGNKILGFRVSRGKKTLEDCFGSARFDSIRFGSVRDMEKSRD